MDIPRQESWSTLNKEFNRGLRDSDATMVKRNIDFFVESLQLIEEVPYESSSVLNLDATLNT